MWCKGCLWSGNERICNACKKARGETSVPAPNVERPVRNAPLEKKKSSGLDSFGNRRVRVRVHSRRHRLCDSDGISGKAVLDGLVRRGVLEDDSPEFVEQVTFTQEKSIIEETVITLEEI